MFTYVFLASLNSPRRTSPWSAYPSPFIEPPCELSTQVLFVRQNVTELKMKEMNEQRERAVLNRKERQYRIAIMSNSFSAFECNLTKDQIMQDIIRTDDGKKISLLERAGLSVPCKASECFERWKQFILPESLEDYCNAVNVDSLKARYEQDEMEVDVDYWGGMDHYLW